jgi:hypothetical protein
LRCYTRYHHGTPNSLLYISASDYHCYILSLQVSPNSLLYISTL